MTMYGIMNDEYYLEGQAAGYEECLDTDNPYDEDSDEGKSWEDGRLSVNFDIGDFNEVDFN